MENVAVRLRSSIRRSHLSRYPKLSKDLTRLARVLRQREHRRITITKDGMDNIFYGTVGSLPRRTRCVIFMSKRMKNILRTAKRIFAGGTFKVRPAKPKSSQVFSICVLWRGHIIPICVLLMASRRTPAYVRLFEALWDCGLNPSKIHTDFESPMYKAFQTVFPEAQVLGCVTHNVRRLRDKVKILRLTCYVRDSEWAARIVRCCGAIALLPPGMMRRGLLVLFRQAKAQGVWRSLKEFLLYVKNTSLKDVLSVFLAKHRTNNVSESWNRSLVTRSVKILSHGIFGYSWRATRYPFANF
ncbi:hypothetical protein ONE63_000017 [Megalurothrips usitatus]|uniref:MULE transposase domain-containing protein n=1 Tax=Megalurothrips usitatus TaxID=439358 RepID=A0AAV7Y090_9NEOP|nr:hypothetical protein ONE63_000017 [Megalurothrips usitatus]